MSQCTRSHIPAEVNVRRATFNSAGTSGLDVRLSQKLVQTQTGRATHYQTPSVQIHGALNFHARCALKYNHEDNFYHMRVPSSDLRE